MTWITFNMDMDVAPPLPKLMTLAKHNSVKELNQ